MYASARATKEIHTRSWNRTLGELSIIIAVDANQRLHKSTHEFILHRCEFKDNHVTGCAKEDLDSRIAVSSQRTNCLKHNPHERLSRLREFVGCGKETSCSGKEDSKPYGRGAA